MNDNMPKSCKEIALLSEKMQYQEANFWEKLRIRMHIMYCKKCKDYNENNEKLSDVLKNAKLDCLSDEEVRELEKLIK